MKRTVWFVLTLMISLHAPLYAHGKHVHGEVDINLVLDGRQLFIEVQSPLENLLGFEYAPRNDKQKAQAQKMAQTLRDAGLVFAFDEASGCVLQNVSLQSEVLESGLLGENSSKMVVNRSADHGNLEASYTFGCAHPEKLRSLRLTIFNAFSGIRKIYVQAVLPAGQKHGVLTPNSAVFSW